jgi:hypothetical protein
MWCGSGSWPPMCRVGVGEVAGDRLRPGAGMALQGAHRGVAGAGQQQRQVGASSAAWVRAEWRSWCSVHPVRAWNSSATRRFMTAEPARWPGPGRVRRRRGLAGGHPGRPVRGSGRPAGGGGAGPTRSANRGRRAELGDQAGERGPVAPPGTLMVSPLPRLVKVAFAWGNPSNRRVVPSSSTHSMTSMMPVSWTWTGKPHDLSMNGVSSMGTRW